MKQFARGALAATCAGAFVVVAAPSFDAAAQGFGFDDANALDTNEAGDLFGTSVVRGDFNGDGRMDLVVAAPGEGARAAGDASGAVFVYWGSQTGLSAAQKVDQSDAGTNEPGDMLGTALAVGDFNGDRIDDLAVGAPGEALEGQPRSGLVFVFAGSRDGFVPLQGLDESQIPAAEAVLRLGGAVLNVNGDRFGQALAAGDFDGDDITDLAIGAPGKATANNARSGALFMFRGTRDQGLSGNQILTQGVVLGDDAGDAFGSVLAAGDFNGDGLDDVAVGVPAQAGGLQRTAAAAGSVAVFRGAPATARNVVAQITETIVSSIAQVLTQADVAGGTIQAGDRFGSAMVAGDFNGDRIMDLAVGSPGDAIGIVPNIGTVSVYLGGARGLAGRQILEQTNLDTNETGDQFGSALAAADFNGDGLLDLAVGAPGEGVGNTQSAGAVYVYAGVQNRFNPALRFDLQSFGTNNASNNRFGAGLTAGDFDGDQRGDLIIGVPNGAAPGTNARSGLAAVVQGVATGLRVDRILDQERVTSAMAMTRQPVGGAQPPQPPQPGPRPDPLTRADRGIVRPAGISGETENP